MRIRGKKVVRRSYNESRGVPKVRASTLLIWGSEDKDTPLSSGRVMAGLIPGSELVVLEGGGHFAYAEQFSKFRLHMRKWLETK